MEAVIGVRGRVRRPRTTRVNRFLRKARERLQKAPSRANAGIGRIKQRVARIRVRGAVGGAAGAAIGRLPNPIPSLRNWASNVFKIASNLREGVRKGTAAEDVIAEADGAAATEPEVEKRVKVLLQVAQDIRNFDPRKSANLVWLANRLKELTDRIVNLLKTLRGARTPQEAEAIAAEVQRDAAEAEATAGEAETELHELEREVVETEPTGMTSRFHKAWLEKAMPDIPVEEITRETRARLPPSINPGVVRKKYQKIKLRRLNEPLKSKKY